MASRVTLRIYYANIARDFLPGGQVYAHTRRLMKSNERLAQRLSPSRTGVLKASIGSEMTVTPPYVCGYHVYTDLERAHYVLGGTTGPIVPTRGRYLWMRPTPYSRLAPSWRPGGRWPFLRVKGQSANNFFGQSMLAALTADGVV